MPGTKDKLVLRDYQVDSVQGVEAHLARKENPLVVIPTGGGKSVVIAETISRLLARPSRPSILLLSHVKELIKQNSVILRRYDPHIAQGIYSAGLKEKRGGARVVMGTVQTVSRSLNALGPRQYILIDEAHLCPREVDSQYGKVFSHFNPSQRVGFTATNLRLDSGSLTEGDDAWFSSVAHEVPVGELIKKGWLVPLSGVLTEQQALLDNVKSRAGDFIAEQAEREVMKLSLDQVVSEMLRLSELRNHILIFAAGVKHAEAVHEELKREGISAGLVLGDTPADDRDHSISKFRDGKLRALVSVGVLTTGFDAPMTDCIASLRPTKSRVLWTQMLGRGMRTSDAKVNCLLLDFVGNLERLGGAGCVLDVRDDRGPARPGSNRRTGKAILEREDPEYTEASRADPMGLSNAGPFEANVTKMRYFLLPSRTQAGKKLVCVDYTLETDEGIGCAARAFICVEYNGYARQKAERWFRRRGCIPSQVPNDAQTAMSLARVMPEPVKVRAYWDPKLKSYMVINEAFGIPI